MARIFTCGFELNSLANGVEVYSNTTLDGSISSAIKNSGGYSYRNNPSAAGMAAEFSFINTDKTVYVRFYYYATTHPASGDRTISLLEGSLAESQIILRGTGAGLRVMDSGNTQQGSDIALNTGQWYRIELKVFSSATVGTIDVKVDGVSKVSVTGVNTGGSTSTVLYVGTTGATTHDFYVDDIGINDTSGSANNTWLGDGRVIALRPNAAGDNNAWTRGGADSGANWSQNSEVTPNDATDYVQSGTVNQIDDYNVGASGIGASDTVNVVHVGARLANDVSDAILEYQLRLKKAASGTVTASTSGIWGSTTWQTNKTSAGAYHPYPITADLDPDGGAWTQTTLDSMQVGAKITTAGTNSLRMSAIWAMVDYTPIVGSAFPTELLSTPMSVTRNTLLRM